MDQKESTCSKYVQETFFLKKSWRWHALFFIILYIMIPWNQSFYVSRIRVRIAALLVIKRHDFAVMPSVNTTEWEIPNICCKYVTTRNQALGAWF